MRKILVLLILGIGLIIIARMPEEKTEPAFSEIVRQMGYDDVSEKPLEVEWVTIPVEFNNVWNNYNILQKESGYDLSLYRGKKCKRYTYLIPSMNARANLLVFEGKIIGGDISSITLDGIMIPIKKE
ncbi:MAG: DUF4830 domain-containing protein [Ruminococcaceae bacterium]|nr:DUF4830 domain-containing protein [Oscillospiraceae bacterium]